MPLQEEHLTDIPVDQVLDFEKGLLEYMDKQMRCCSGSYPYRKGTDRRISEAGLVKAITRVQEGISGRK